MHLRLQEAHTNIYNRAHVGPAAVDPPKEPRSFPPSYFSDIYFSGTKIIRWGSATTSKNTHFAGGIKSSSETGWVARRSCGPTPLPWLASALSRGLNAAASHWFGRGVSLLRLQTVWPRARRPRMLGHFAVLDISVGPSDDVGGPSRAARSDPVRL